MTVPAPIARTGVPAGLPQSSAVCTSWLSGLLKQVLLPGTDGLTMLNPIRHWKLAIGVAHGPDRADVVSTVGSTGGSLGALGSLRAQPAITTHSTHKR